MRLKEGDLSKVLRDDPLSIFAWDSLAFAAQFLFSRHGRQSLQENGGDGAEEQNLKNCGCDLLIVQNNASVAVQDKVYVCSPIANQVQVVLEFDPWSILICL